MAKKSSFVDDVLASAGRTKPGYSGWFDRLPAEAQREMQVAWERFDPAIHQKKTYARAVIAAAQERGWQTSGIQGVIAWLAKGR